MLCQQEMSRSAGCNGAAWQGTRLLPANLQPGGRAELTLGYKPLSGLETKYTLSIPTSYSSLVAWPLLVGFHGWGGSGTWSFDKFHEHAKEAGYIVASPVCRSDPPYGPWLRDARLRRAAEWV